MLKKLNKKIIIIIFLCTIFFILAMRACIENNNSWVKPKVRPLTEAIYALGTVKADNVFTLKAGIPWSIKKIYVSEGQYVQKGAPLLMNDSFVSFDAPFSGTITKVYCEEGENVIMGTPLLTMMDLKKMHVIVSLNQNSALRVKKNQPVQLSVETLRGIKLTGIVTSIYPSNGQFLAKIKVDNMPNGLLPEMTTDVAIEVAKKEKALLIPLTSVKNDRVKIKRKNKIIDIKVTIGAVDESWCEILDNTILPDDYVYIKK